MSPPLRPLSYPNACDLRRKSRQVGSKSVESPAVRGKGPSAPAAAAPRSVVLLLAELRFDQRENGGQGGVRVGPPRRHFDLGAKTLHPHHQAHDHTGLAPLASLAD